MRLAWLLVLAACYHPKIADGTIFCSADTPPKCPSGLSCAFDGLCYQNPPAGTPYGDGALGRLDLSLRDFGGKPAVMLLHTDSGRITLEQEGMPSEDLVPSPTPIPIYSQVGGPPVTIWSFTTLVVPQEVTIRISPESRAVPVLAATGEKGQTPQPTLKILGPIDLATSGGRNGGPSQAGSTGDPNSTAAGGGGAAMGSAGGGGGGGNLDPGGDGGGTGGGKGEGDFSGIPEVITFGSGGGGGGGPTSSDVAGFGGSGGGALGLLGFWVHLNSPIDLSGGAGQPAEGGDAGGGGGGAGGTLLVAGDTLTLGSNAVITVNGGAGGNGSGSGGAGGLGAAGRIRLRYAHGKLDKSPSTKFVPSASETELDSALQTFPTAATAQ